MPCNDCSRAETCPPCVNSSARERLAEAIWGNNDLTYEEADKLIDDYAHELAEKLRRLAAPAAMLRSERMQGFAKGARAAADLIDPPEKGT